MRAIMIDNRPPYGHPSELEALNIVPRGSARLYYTEDKQGNLIFNIYALHQHFIERKLYRKDETMYELMVRLYGLETYIRFHREVVKLEWEELE